MTEKPFVKDWIFWGVIIMALMHILVRYMTKQ